MWHTSEGDRILEGAEAALFKAGVTSLVEKIKDEANYESRGYGIPLFDNLTWSQRLAVIETVVTNLLVETTGVPRLTAVNEAAIGSIFEHVSFQIDQEINSTPSPNLWRQLVLDACHEAFGELAVHGDVLDECETDNCMPSSAASRRCDLWHPLVHSLSDRILWDRDFEMMDEFLDEPPEKAAILRQIMGIDDDYFATAAEDLTSLETVGKTLHRLAGILE